MPDEHECQFREDIKEIKDGIKSLHDKLFVGNGQPPITVQLDRLNVFKKTMYWALGITVIAVIGIISRLIVANLT